MATPPDPSKPDSPAPHYEQPNWQVQGTVINTPGPVHIGRPKQPPPPPDPNRIKMLKQARQQVDDVLHTSLWNEAKIALRLAKDTARPYNVELQAPERPPVLLPEDTQIIEVYDRYQHQNLVLILGEPGGGKTTLLLELAERLVGRAEADAAHPLPVVFNLSTWGEEKPALHDWMVDQLHRTYHVPKKIGVPWVDGGQILPLLDGLDEVDGERRAACAEAINDYRANHAGAWATPMVVCCRSEEYRTLPALQGATAITVQVLTHAEIDAYLTGGGQRLEGVRGVLRGDPTLYDLLKTPMLLSIIALAFVDTPAEDLHTATTPELRKQAIFAAFVRRMFATKPIGRGEDARYPRRRILSSLRWLARQLDMNSLTLYQMELMQPDWVEGIWRQRLVRWSAALVGGLVGGLLGGLGSGLSSGLVGRLLGVLGSVLVGGLSVGLGVGLNTRTIKPIDYLRWSWQSFHESWRHILFFGLGSGLVGGLVGGLGGGLSFGLAVGIFVGLAVWLIGGLFGMIQITVSDSRMSPNQGIRRSFQNMLFGGLFGGLFFVFVGGLFFVLYFSEIDLSRIHRRRRSLEQVKGFGQ